jgi:ribose transport system ATP-binding protein
MILICDELLEAIGMADRILVFKNGKVQKEILRNREISEEEIVEVML